MKQFICEVEDCEGLKSNRIITSPSQSSAIKTLSYMNLKVKNIRAYLPIIRHDSNVVYVDFSIRKKIA